MSFFSSFRMNLRAAALSRLDTSDHGSKHVDPASDGFVGSLDTALCQEILDVSIAEGEAKIRPDGALDDVGRETVATV
jgi:hypothetical protein